MDIIYELTEASVADVTERLPDNLSNSAIRSHLRILVNKGHLEHFEKDGCYIYKPTRPRQNAAESALNSVLKTFFDNSMEKVVAALLSKKDKELDADDLDKLQALIDQARENKG